MPGRIPQLRVILSVALILAGALSTSCHKGPTDPSDNVIETFTGTVALQGQDNHTFHVSNQGELFITVVSVAPPLAAGVYGVLALGSNNGGTCIFDGTVQNNFAQQGTNISIPAVEGDFCVAFADKFDFTVPESYSISVSHP